MKKLIMLFALALLNINITLTTSIPTLSHYINEKYLYIYNIYQDINKLQAQASDIFKTEILDISKIPIRMPLEDSSIVRISSKYGERQRHPILNRRTFHNGIDLVANKGTKIIATAPGKVIRTGYEFLGYGRFIEIQHEYNISTIYAHLHKINVSTGDYVDSNTIIGEVGNTGLSTGNHLHYEIRSGMYTIDPLLIGNIEYSSKEDLQIFNKLSNAVQTMKTTQETKKMTLEELKSLRDTYVQVINTHLDKFKSDVVLSTKDIDSLLKKVEIESENLNIVKELLAKANSISLGDTITNNHDIFKLALLRDLKTSLNIAKRKQKSNKAVTDVISEELKEITTKIDTLNKNIQEYNKVTNIEITLTKIH